VSEDGAAGSVREAGGLTFVKVYKAGHMVPMDQPKHALDMITRFTRGQSFKPPTTTATGSMAASRKLRPKHKEAGAQLAAEKVVV
jgi:hypothetical protein